MVLSVRDILVESDGAVGVAVLDDEHSVTTTFCSMSYGFIHCFVQVFAKLKWVGPLTSKK